MRESAFDIKVTTTTAHEQKRGEPVDDDAGAGDDHDGEAADRLRREEALRRFDGDATDRDQENDRVGERRQD
jgi:hypothetical protein